MADDLTPLTPPARSNRTRVSCQSRAPGFAFSRRIRESSATVGAPKAVGAVARAAAPREAAAAVDLRNARRFMLVEVTIARGQPSAGSRVKSIAPRDARVGVVSCVQTGSV